MSRVFSWYEQAMRLFKASPVAWCVLGATTLASDLVLQLVPGIGVAASKVIVPVIECGMLLGAAAVDHGQRLEIGYAIAAFRAPPPALTAIVGSALVIFVAEALAGFAFAGINFLSPEAAKSDVEPSALVGIFAIGMVTSLPMLFVPFAALFERASVRHAFVTSFRGFALNTAPLLLFGALALVLTLLGLMTYGVGLVIVFPLLSAASYAAWKDIYAAEELTHSE